MEASQGGSRHGYAFFAVLVLLLVVAIFARWRLDAAGASESAGPNDFSAKRAAGFLPVLLGDQQPHPVDSAANRALGQRLIDALQSAGYRPEVQEATSCSEAMRTCARVRNIIAVSEGSAAGKAVLVASHYDSVPAGPGASDNAAGVAIMVESARLLKQRPAGKNSIVFLFTEGEEAGLLGAQAFASHHPRMSDVVAVVNVEARGTSGQSILFETGRANGKLIGEFAAAAKRPLTSSLLATAYGLMPNDTDLSVFKSRGLQGLNFANGEGSSYYHTPLDNLRHIDAGTLQAQGDNIHELLKRLADADLRADGAASDAVYSDVLGFGVLQWPTHWGPFIAVGLLLAFAAAALRLRKRGALAGRGVARGIVGFVLSPVVGGVVAYALTYLLSLFNGAGRAWAASGQPFNRVLLWSAVLIAVVSLLRQLARRSDPLRLWIGLGWAWSFAACAAAIAAPGASYLFLLPAAAMAVCTLIASALPRSGEEPRGLWLLAIPAAVGFVFLFPAIHLIEVMLGFNSVAGVVAMGALLALAATFALPFAASVHAPRAHAFATAALLAAVAAGAFFALRAPAYSAQHPQPLNVMYIQTGDKAVMAVGNASNRPPAQVLKAMGGDVALAPVFAWNQTRFHSVSMPSAGLPAAALTVVAETSVSPQERRVTVRIDAPAGASVIQLLVPEAAQLRTIETDGQILDYSKSSDDYASFICRGVSCNGREIVLVLGPRKQKIAVVAMSPQLPGRAAAVASSRGEVAVPRNDGDQALVVGETQL